MKLPTVAIVGRPNVKKSTLFNKIAHEKIAIAEDVPDVPRDCICQEVSYQNKPFYLIGTGEIDTQTEKLNQEIDKPKRRILK